MVNSPSLTTDSILTAMETGSFYASSGVTLSEIQFDGSSFSFRIESTPGTVYRTEFIASSSAPRDDDDLLVLPEGVGQVVGVDSTTAPAYRLAGDELYVRARVTSSRLKANPYRAGEYERAWTQPVVSR
jgi:hypothetical protein